MQTHADNTPDNHVTFTFWSQGWATAVHCMSAKFGVGSSSHFPIRARTHTKSQMPLITVSVNLLLLLLVWITRRVAICSLAAIGKYCRCLVFTVGRLVVVQRREEEVCHGKFWKPNRKSEEAQQRHERERDKEVFSRGKEASERS